MTEDKTLQQALEAGLIDLNTLRIQLENQKMQEAVEAHPYSIWKGRDGKWRTYVYDPTKKYNRRLIKRTTELGIHKFLYQETLFKQEQEEKKQRIKLSKFFPIWLRHKEKHTNSPSYISRIVSDWNRFYIKDPIVDKYMDEISGIYLDDWFHSIIKNHNLTKTQFYNMSIILRQGFLYAKQKNIIQDNPCADIKINTKMFRHNKKPPDETQVFLEGEQEQIAILALKEYQATKTEDALAVFLNFQLGLRSGELAAIKEIDIEDEKYLHVQRMEIRDYDLTDVLKPKYSGKKVVEFTKTSESDRYVYLTYEVREQIKEVIEFHKINLTYDEGFIFLKHGKRMDSSCLNQKLEKYCQKLGIPEKRIHKIRKTYISTLIDGGVNINEIRKLVGHTNEKTTLRNYCFNRKDKFETEAMLELIIKNPTNN